MRVLLLFRGSAGCGKSTYIEKHGLKPYTLCVDDIRLLCSSPVLQVSGERAISQANDRVAWNTLFRILETRMKHGEFTVIDATNSKTSELNKYKDLAKDYRYGIYCIDMTDIPIEEVKRRNRERENIKRVPDEVIDKFYSRFATQQIPSGIKIIKPDELNSIWYEPMDLSKYEKIHVIGDIHGCYTALKEYVESIGGIQENNYYIFTGDYIDRGLENVKVMNYLCDLCEKPNVIFLEGNHEKWLWMWSSNLVTNSKEFEFITKQQFIESKLSQKKIRKFYRKLCQCCFFKYHDKKFIVTHGGISNVPENFTKIATEQMIRGVGNYDDADAVDSAFFNNTDNTTYQIHGHRNIMLSPVKTTERTFNLEGQVEFGGHLRAVQITKDSIIPIEVKNNVFREPKTSNDEKSKSEKVDMPVQSLVEIMRQDQNIYERRFGRVSSFNFTRRAFEKGAWSHTVNRARGLYIDTVDYKIVARAYEKFFNINEMPETKLNNLQHTLKFPVTAYVKENGFLGIVGWNSETDDLLITSKSSPTSDFSGYFKNALYDIYGSEKIQKMKEYIQSNNVSFVFECCDIVNDPHIIEYDESKVVLLDVIKNQIEFEKLSYDELVVLADEIGFVLKERAVVLDTWTDFYNWYNEVLAEDYKYKGNNIEGFVIEDYAGFMVKVKLSYYKLWRKLRGVAQSTFKKGNYKYTGSFLTPLENKFFGWCKNIYATLPLDEREEFSKEVSSDICSLRKLFLHSKTEHDKTGDKTNEDFCENNATYPNYRKVAEYIKTKRFNKPADTLKNNQL